MQNMRDPAAGVPPALLPHMHLVSKYRYPTIHQATTETIISFLMEAPKIVRDLQPMHWTYLDAPPDGSLMLVWQPLEQMQTAFASDGYIYADMEHAFCSENKGYTVEMYVHRAGYHPPNERIATHSRKRYRLMPPKVPNPNIPPCDPSLWLVHYTKADQRDHVAAANIPPLQGVQIIQNQRKALQSLGQLPRKEFMLHDKSNYPTINLPSGLNAQNFPHPNFFARQQQQQQGMQGIAVPGVLGPSPNRGMPGRSGHIPRPSVANVEPSIDEEEDVSRGDLLDFMTPRDISKVRYEQHHEWMEEIVASPFATKQIIPTDLGLGRMGELEALTRGFFESPSGLKAPTAANDESSSVHVGKMDVGKAEEFSKIASQKVSEITAEIEALKRQHTRRMAKLQKTGILTAAEKRLRKAALSRTEGGKTADQKELVDHIVSEVEAAWGKQIGAIADVTCVEKGGLEEPTTNSTLKDVNGIDEMKLDLTNDRATDQNADVQMAQAGSNGSSEPQPRSQTASRHTSPSVQPDPPPVPADEARQSELLAPSTAPTEEPPPAEQPQHEIVPDIPTMDDMNMDIEMAGLDEDAPTADEAAISAADDWVMVSDEASKPTSPPEPTLEQQQAQTQAQPQIQPQTTLTQPQANPTSSAPPPQPPVSAPDTSTTTPQPATALTGTTPTATNEQAEMTPAAITPAEISNTDFDISANFDSAGEALDAYGAENEGPGLDLDDMGMGDLDDSAFGEAFQPEAS